jgi:hypothetical protein
MATDHSPAPTAASTNPVGNSSPAPTPFARGISPHVKEKDHPEQRARIHEHLARKHTESGHARD